MEGDVLMPSLSVIRGTLRRLRTLDGHRRSLCLLVTGALLIGYGMALLPMTVFTLPLYAHIHMRPFAIAWIVCGAVALIGAIPPVPRWIGYAAAPLMPILWCLLFAGAFIFGTAPGTIEGVTIWGSFACFILIVAGWKESTHYRYRGVGKDSAERNDTDDEDEGGPCEY